MNVFLAIPSDSPSPTIEIPPAVAENYVTRSQYDQLVADLRVAEEQLARARQSIGEAAEKGDLSENSEYDAAREAEQFFLARVVQFRERIAECRILDRRIEFSGEIAIGTRVILLDLSTEEHETYTIVGGGAFDFDKGEMPYNSPFASGLVGRRAGEEVVVTVPAGKLRYKIISVEAAE
jgi:transcription elongation factor GreA